VVFSRFVPEPAIMSMLVFGLPVMMAVAVMFWWLVNAPNGAESPTAAISIAAALFGGFVILGILDKLFRKRYPVTLATGSEAAGLEKYPAADAAGSNIMDGKNYPAPKDTGNKAKGMAL